MKIPTLLACFFLVSTAHAQDIRFNILSATPPTANNASITLDLLTNDAPFYFNWEGPAITDNNQHQQNLQDLQPGEYCVTVTNGQGCIAKGCAQVPDCSINALPLSLQATTSCLPTTNTWLLDLSPARGFPYYTFQWTGPNFTSEIEDIEVNQPGTYTVTVSDLCGHQVSETFEIGLLVEAQITPVCSEADGTIELHPLNGEPPFQYLWDTGETTAAITNLNEEKYTVTITAASGCSSVQTYEVPASLSLQAHITPTCPNGPNGSIDLLPSGGTPPYQYTWSHTGTTDLAPYAYNLSAGQYCVTLTDANSCTTEACYDISVDAQGQPSAIESAMIEHVCGPTGTGRIDLQLPGNSLLYTVQWDNGAQSASINHNAL